MTPTYVCNFGGSSGLPNMRLSEDASGSRGLTAIEVLVSMLLLSAVSIFAMQVFEYSRRIHLETEQYDFAARIARDVLKELKSGENWRNVKDRRESVEFNEFGARFDFQLKGTGTDSPGITSIELSVSWVGPRDLEQAVFSTHVYDPGGAGE